VLDTDATIAALSAAPSSTALLLDFDGTLSPIVARPDDARPHPAVLDHLRAVAPVLGRVAVVSGRSVDFLDRHVDVPGVVFAGLYGLELLDENGHRVHPAAQGYAEAIAAAAGEAEARLPGVLVERKGGVTVTLHWRMVPDREAEVRAVASDLAHTHGLDAPQRGRMAVELRPPVRVDKGTAVDALVAGFAVGAFVGDDAGDLPAFAALGRAASEGRLQRAVRIGVLSPEAPPDLVAHVDAVVDGPDGLVALLEALRLRLGE